MLRRADVAEIAGVSNDLDVAVACRQALQFQHRVIGGCIVDEDVFVTVIAGFPDRSSYALVQFEDIALLVETRSQDAQSLRHDGYRLYSVVLRCIRLRYAPGLRPARQIGVRRSRSRSPALDTTNKAPRSPSASRKTDNGLSPPAT